MGEKKDNTGREKKSKARPSWNVRNEKGEIFGPADMDTLVDWARDGRLAPTHEVSRDGDTWQDASALRELQMNWVSQIAPGSFYGPIHQAALRELMHEKSIDPDAPLFHRHFGDVDTDPGQTESDLRNQMKRTEYEFTRKLADYNAEISRHKREKEKINAELQAKDMEFEAERSELMAGIARKKAELLKRDSMLEALGEEVETLEKTCQGHQAAEVKRHEMENALSELKKRQHQEIKQVRQENERQRKQWRTELENHKKESLRIARDLAQSRARTEALRAENLEMKKRSRTLQKHLQEALDIAEGDRRESKDSIETATIVASTPAGEVQKTEGVKGAPPVDTTSRSQHALATIEAQAQREIQTLKNNAIAYPPIP